MAEDNLSPLPKVAHPFRLGMSSDVALRHVKSGQWKALRKPLRVGTDARGSIIWWFLRGVSLRFTRARLPGPYRIDQIVAPGEEQIKGE